MLQSHFSIATAFYSPLYNYLLILFILCISVQMNYGKMSVPRDQILLNLKLKIGRLLSLFAPFHILEEFSMEPLFSQKLELEKMVSLATCYVLSLTDFSVTGIAWYQCIIIGPSQKGKKNA